MTYYRFHNLRKSCSFRRCVCLMDHMCSLSLLTLIQHQLQFSFVFRYSGPIQTHSSYLRFHPLILSFLSQVWVSYLHSQIGFYPLETICDPDSLENQSPRPKYPRIVCMYLYFAFKYSLIFFCFYLSKKIQNPLKSPYWYSYLSNL